jgi:hypothetical protein
MKKHVAIKISSTEEIDLASIIKHPGMFVFVEKVLKGHVDQQLAMIFEVQPDDPDRLTKLAAISGTAYAMQLMLELARTELRELWKKLEAQEVKRKREAEKQ